MAFISRNHWLVFLKKVLYGVNNRVSLAPILEKVSHGVYKQALRL